MTLPDRQHLMLPFLRRVSDGREHLVNDIADELADEFELSQEDRSLALSSGETVFRNTVWWARTYLTKAGLLESPRRGAIKITACGLDVLKDTPTSIDDRFLMHFPEFARWRGPEVAREFNRRISVALRMAGIPFMEQAVVSGIAIDFLVNANGRAIAIEAKSWTPTDANINRAIEQSRLYKEVTRVDRVYFVLDRLQRSRPADGVIKEEDVISVIENTIHEIQGREKEPVKPSRPTKRTIFAAMPFSAEYDDVYLVAMSYAAESVNAVCKRVDYEGFSGDVVSEIKRLIQRSIAVIADISESKSNVLYEVGYAHALRRPTIHICSTPLSSLPFDIRNWNTLEYSKGQTFKLREELSERLKDVLTREGLL